MNDRRRLSIGDLTMIIVGIAVGLAIFSVGASASDRLPTLALGFFGGIALVGPPLLLFRKYRHGFRRPWGAGNLLWFAQGTAAWLLCPPVVLRRVLSGGTEAVGGSTSAVCFAYGTPLMSLYLVVALIAGGRLGLRRKRRRPRRPRNWTETFGLILGLGWACVGGYFIVQFWMEDLRR
ncbi:MAG: hypothetical protein SFX72_17170 [Isosphaeraceae bacterium]|nr:hypothetical protein [Isosphaeraceae bacterium]